MLQKAKIKDTHRIAKLRKRKFKGNHLITEEKYAKPGLNGQKVQGQVLGQKEKVLELTFKNL